MQAVSLPLSGEAVPILGDCLGVFTSTQPWAQQTIENLGHQSKVRTARGGALASSSTVETSDYCPHLPLLPAVPVPAMAPLKPLLWVKSLSTGSSRWDPLRNSNNWFLLKRPPRWPKPNAPPRLYRWLSKFSFYRWKTKAPPFNMHFLSPYYV